MSALVRRALVKVILAAGAACLLAPAHTFAQSDGGFVYALRQVDSAPNQIYGFSVDSSTGMLTPVPGSPFPAGGNGTSGVHSESLVYDGIKGRLYSVNRGSGTIGAFAVNRSTGALTALPFSPITLPSGGIWGSIAISPDGSILAAGDGVSHRLATFVVSSTDASTAPGNLASTTLSASPFSIEFSRDGRYVYAGGSFGDSIGAYAVSESGRLTRLGGAPFSAGEFAVGYATDSFGRLFAVNLITMQVRVFTSSSSGVLTPVAGGPFPSGLTQAIAGVLHPAGAYFVADRASTRIGVFLIQGAGSGTTVSPAAGSPFLSGGAAPNTLALNADGSLLFAGQSQGRNITTFRVNGNLTLASVSVQPVDTLGASGVVTGLAYAPAAPAREITEFIIPTAGAQPRGITAGPDGNVWFTEFVGNRIGRIRPDGTITEFPLVAGSQPSAIVAGPDGNLWFTELGRNRIGRITPAGGITEFVVPTAASQPEGITVGPDNNLWFTEYSGNKIGRISTTGAITEFPLPAGGNPARIAPGPDGNLWFTLYLGNRIGRMTTAGVVTEFPLPTAGSLPFNITAGADGAVWFSQFGGARMGRITTSGAIAQFSSVGTSPSGLTVGPDAHLWYLGARVGRLTLDGSVTEYSPPSAVGSGGITSGPDGNIWFTQAISNRIGMLRLPKVPVFVNKNGSGTGLVSGTVGGTSRINCGVTCGALVVEETVVTLTASAGASSRFVGWSGGGCTGTAPCVISPSSTTTVTATFDTIPTFTVSPSTLNFGASNFAGTLRHVTPPQVLHLTQTAGSAAAWTATTESGWVSVTPTSGTGSATLLVSIHNSLGGLPSGGTFADTVTITAVGAAGPTTATVNLTLRTPSEETGAFGSFDTPTNGQGDVTGSIAVTGWALDDIGITRVRIVRDPVGNESPSVQPFIGLATFVAGARPDVAAAFPTLPHYDRAGWGILVLTNFLPNQGNGTFTLHAYVDDLEGRSTLLGSKTITCTNATATLPFGAIDTPLSGGRTSGAAFVNFGWALTPHPKSIPTDGSTIQVFLDSVSLGPLTSYNHARSDIQALFPGYANTNGAVGYKTIDTTALANGVHTISWTVTDNAGATAGIGSRFFTVSNGVAGAVGPITAAMTDTRAIGHPDVIDASAAVIDKTEGTDAIDAVTRAVSSARGVRVRYGFETDDAVEVVAPGADDVRRVTVAPEQRLVVDLSAGDDTRARYRGFTLDRGVLRALPVGSNLDVSAGRFVWIPPMAFGGTHALLFLREAESGDEQIRIDVAIAVPKARAPELAIDLPSDRATVGPSFTVAGWAIDPAGPARGSGIDTLHVWAHPVDGTAPRWLGVARYGGRRPDVAAQYGARFLDSGFSLAAAGLPSGEYFVVVYAHSIAGNRFSVAKAVQVTVR
jgi:streptogramin lyase